MALTKVSTGVVDMSASTGGLVIAKGTTAQQLICNPPTTNNLGSIRENIDSGVNKVEVCTSTGWQFLEEAGPSFISLTVDYLVVAGGGGGGAYSRINTSLGGTGGGAGGYRTSFGAGNVNGGNTAVENTLTLATGSPGYTVTVGAGGAGGPVNPTPTNASTNPTIYADQGDNSVFHTITSTGGGGGYEPFYGFSATTLRGGSNAGSGGNGIAAVSYTTSPVQGFIGGRNTTYSSPFGSGGGGGASSVGGNGGSSSLGGGNGGAGFSNQISGTAVDYAGGGGGSVNKDQGVAGTATFGGGDGNRNGAGYDGTLNTGGGGGGASGPDTYTSYKGGDGGSGVVILRFPISFAAPIESNISPAGGLTTSVSVDGGYRVVTYTCTTNATVSATITFA